MKKVIILGVSILFLLAACNSKKVDAKIEVPEGTSKIEVVEHANGGGYTFIKGNVNGSEKWIAVREMPVETGDVYYYKDAMEMKNFESKSLNRTFDSILFVNEISKNVSSSPKSGKAMPGMASSAEGHTKPKVEPAKTISVKPLEGGKTVQAIAKGKAELKGQIVKIRGVVTKFNGNIMGRNWIHIQDGTKYDQDIDVTVTSDQSAKVGETIVVEGTLATDKDFGAGYFYDMIIENAKITVEEKI